MREERQWKKSVGREMYAITSFLQQIIKEFYSSHLFQIVVVFFS